jgi:CHAT domain-containing protein
LYRQLIEPVEATGALAGGRRLVILPHAELHYLPFAALIRPGDRRGEADEFLIERYDIGYAPSASVWLRLGGRSARGPSGVLALAPRTAALPGSREEVEAIRALYGREATVLANGAASEPAFRAAAPRYEILHLATYGVLNKHNPLFSYVSLNPGAGADGRLEVHEVFGLTLDARLIVLSACQTALGSGAVSDVPPGDDWVGLVRAFLSVGADNVIATLWPVEDRSTARLMERLHRGLRSGASEATALAAAQRAALRVPETADPFYWAGIVLVGGR